MFFFQQIAFFCLYAAVYNWLIATLADDYFNTQLIVPAICTTLTTFIYLDFFLTLPVSLGFQHKPSS